MRKHHAAGEVLRALREKQLLVLPFDQNSTRGLGVFVDFFGLTRPARMPGSHASALRADAPIVPVFIVRQGGSARHRAHVLPIMEARAHRRLQADVLATTARRVGRVRGHGAAVSRAVAVGAPAVEDAPAGRAESVLKSASLPSRAPCGARAVRDPRRVSRHRPPNVVIVLVDTLRPDYLGSYGRRRGLTPFVDDGARRGTRFTHAYATSSWTEPVGGVALHLALAVPARGVHLFSVLAMASARSRR